jgi:hypothetical protein
MGRVAGKVAVVAEWIQKDPAGAEGIIGSSRLDTWENRKMWPTAYYTWLRMSPDT